LDFINLQSASYLVNENFLNVTFWIKSLDKLPSTNSLRGNVTYGILINSDPSSNTGKDGVDYQYEITLDKNTEKVRKEFREISNEGYTKRIKAYTDAYYKILEKGNNYITMDLDLNDILSPKVFKVLFYAIYESPNNKNNDSSRFIDLFTMGKHSPTRSYNYCKTRVYKFDTGRRWSSHYFCKF